MTQPGQTWRPTFRDYVELPSNDLDDWAPGQLDQWLADALWACAYQHHDVEYQMPAPDWFVSACRQVWAYRRERGI